MTKYLFLFLLLFSIPSFAQDTLIVSKSEIQIDSSNVEEVRFEEKFKLSFSIVDLVCHLICVRSNSCIIR